MWVIQKWIKGQGWQSLALKYTSKAKAQIALRNLPRGRYRIIEDWKLE